MTFTHALSTNNYGEAKFIVTATASNGTHTTIAAALAVASSGDTIFIRAGTYTENITLVAGVNLCAFDCDAQTPNVTIIGKCTMTTAGSVTISGIRLKTNSDYFLAVTGSVASVVILKNCYLNCSNNTGINFTSSSASSSVSLYKCDIFLDTTGITLFTSTAAGEMYIFNCNTLPGSAATATASSTSTAKVEMRFTRLSIPLSTSSTGNFDLFFVHIENTTANTTCITLAGTGTSAVQKCNFYSGSASSLSIGAGTTLKVHDCICESSNANAITGAGAVIYSNVTMKGTSSEINTTTQTTAYDQLGKWRAQGQPAFLAQFSTGVTDVTGDGTNYTVILDTEIFDQDSNYNTGTGTFTAPVTGRYHFEVQALFGGLLNTHTQSATRIVTSNRTYSRSGLNPYAAGGVVGGQFSANCVALCDMDVGDVANFTLSVSNGTKVVDLILGSSTDPRTWFSGNLMC